MSQDADFRGLGRDCGLVGLGLAAVVLDLVAVVEGLVAIAERLLAHVGAGRELDFAAAGHGDGEWGGPGVEVAEGHADGSELGGG